MAAAVNKGFDGADIQKYLQLDSVDLSDPADPAVDILFLAGERNPRPGAVKNDLSRFSVIIQKRLVFTAAEQLEARPCSRTGFNGDRQLNGAAADSIYTDACFVRLKR